MKLGTLALVFAATFANGLGGFSAAAQEPAQTRTDRSEASLAEGTTINAELNSPIDSKRVKPGDAVIAHTTAAVKSLDDRTILPRGTKLVGHVTQATARAKGDSESSLGISFDKAIVKGGEEVPLNAAIQALAAPAGMSSSVSDVDTLPSAGSPSANPGVAGNTSAMAGERDSRTHGTTGYPTGNGSGSDRGADGGANSSGELAANRHGVFGMNGLRLTMADSHHTQASVISAAGKNVHLDSGTRLLLVTQAAPGN